MLTDGGECVSDLGAVREQDALFGAVASDSTAFRVVDRIASEPGLLDAVRDAHARARARFWELHGAPERLTLDVDATLITAHSEKEKAAGNYKGGYGFHPLQVYLDETREAMGALLRPGTPARTPLLIMWRSSTRRLSRSRPSTSRRWRSWCVRTPPVLLMVSLTTAARPTCASRSAMS